MKRYFIVSDIHSQFDLLLVALVNADFDVENPDHVLVIAGDILDRGTQGDSVIRFLELLIKKERLLGVLGNHDKFIQDILTQKSNYRDISWNIEHNGFLQTLLLGLDPQKITNIDQLIVLEEMRKNFESKYPIFSKWILSLPLFLEFDRYVIVHGFLDFTLSDWHDTCERYAIWERGFKTKIPNSFKKTLIFGHTPNRHFGETDDIIYESKKIMIDGGAAMGHQINVLQLTEEQI
ncbi:MAG: metallophosphoesterase [Bacilli bacterium]|nr:metallophosphoesterase [Bacilli bacterium]MBN2877152.1 metallophosphoesterase [Bacilli bacterium]